MNDFNEMRPRDAGSAGESGVDARRYLGVVRRSRGMIIGIVAVITATVVALSLALPKTYESTATIALNVNSSSLGALDAESTQRRLATIKSLIGSPSVDVLAAESLPGLTEDDIHNAVTAAVDPEANLVEVTASDRVPAEATKIANAVARAFLEVETRIESRGLAAALSNLRQQLRAVESDPNAGTEVAALRQRISDLTIQRASAGSDLQLVESGEVPTTPASPRPLRNGILAFFAALFLGVLVALARDQFRPAIDDPRQLSRLTGWPVLAGIPRVRARGHNRLASLAVEHEAYQTLSAAFQQVIPPGGPQRVVLVTSSVHAEGKTTVVARLGQSLAQAGQKILLISADLRWPSLHEAFDLPLEPGLTEVLNLTTRAGVSRYVLPATAHAIPLSASNGRGPGELHVLTSGSPPVDPSSLLAGQGAQELFRHIRTFDYSYILVDGPPTVGIADVQPLIRLTDEVLFVARLDRFTIENIVDVQDLFGRLGVTPLGSVVLGARVDASPYYLNRPPISSAV